MSFAANFEKTLNDFFAKHHPRKAKKVAAIAEEFKGQEKEVMLHLCKKYKVDTNTIPGLNTYVPPVVEETPALEESTDEVAEESAEETSKEQTSEEETSEEEEK